MTGHERVELRIGRVVWHGRGAPDAQVLAAAVQAALERALARQQVPAAASTLGSAGDVIARSVLPSLPKAQR